MSAEQALEGLDEDQRRAATYFSGPLAIIAGAGSGKTTTVSARLAYGCLSGELDSERILALTFTTRAAGQLRSRLASLNAPAIATRTIHSAALRQLRYFWPMLDGTRPPQVLADGASLVRDAAESLGVRLAPRAVRDLLTDITWAKSNFIDETRFAAEYSARRGQAGNAHTAARIYAEYELLKRKTFAMDFDDVLLYLLALLDEHGDALAMVRRQYQHITVDEFQDLTPLQFRVLKEWVGPRGSVCAVGDPAQAIYGFAGATASYLRRFEHEFGRAHVVQLRTNYRSAKTIVSAAVHVGDQDKPLSHAQPTAQLGSVLQLEHADAAAEVYAIGERIIHLLQLGQQPQGIAVLVRQQEQARHLATELRGMGIPTVERAATDLFERPEVRQALHRLRTAALLEPDADALHTVTRIATELGWTQAPDPSAQPSLADSTWDSLAILVEVARRLHEQDSQTAIFDVLEELERRAEAFDIPAAPAVSLLTMHAAKGLEWDVVFIPSVNNTAQEGRNRDGGAAAARDEEARLLYVAMTRAKQQVVLSWSQQAGGRSPLLSGLPRDVAS